MNSLSRIYKITAIARLAEAFKKKPKPPKKDPRVLFILKLGNLYGRYSHHGYKSSGLFNSATLVSDMLNAAGIPSTVVQVIDNNGIDRAVTLFKPTHTIIEALWVVPEKFEVLIFRHPTVKWVVRIHSEMPFLSQEGIAINWIKGYAIFPQVKVGANSREGYREIAHIIGQEKTLYLPNYYPVPAKVIPVGPPSTTIDVGCFGAIRPLKNQLIQALAAMTYANSTNRVLRFHVNSTRVEQGGGPILKNLRALFSATRHKLVEHPWMVREEFLELLLTMNLSMAVSLSETFCIVAADSVVSGVPLVASSAIPWVVDGITPPTKVDNIIDTISVIFGGRFNSQKNLKSLAAYSRAAQEQWLDVIQ